MLSASIGSAVPSGVNRNSDGYTALDIVHVSSDALGEYGS
jgi:hypothetical protein